MKKNIFTRIFAIALVAMSIMAIAIPAMADASHTVTVTVDTNSPRGDGGTLNLRKTRSTSSQILKYIPNGTSITVTYTNKRDDWYACTYEGKTGYVKSIFMKFSNNTYGGTINETTDYGYRQYLGGDGTSSNLRNGQMDSQYVENLQIMLNSLGYDCGIPDGDFGTNTENALKRFQRNNSLSDDGIAGKKTKQRIWIKLNYSAPSGCTPIS